MVVWAQVNWRKLERIVYKLQKRIYQAAQRGDVKAVRKLQKTLLNSWSAKMLAILRITQDNKGYITAGVDGKKSLSPKERLMLASDLVMTHKAKATPRIWIPKPGKTEKTPLEIPTISERAKQALVKMVMEPEWEAKFEPNSYGFRPGKSCMDAVEGIKAAIKQKSKYVLDADIAKCFDQIDREKLLTKISTFPKVRRQIKAWLKSGVCDNGSWFPTNEGTSQGGVISPLLANIALHGMEKIVKEFARTLRGEKGNNEKEITLIRYADNFVILHPNLDVVTKAKALIEEFLKGMGLELKPEKTRFTHTLLKVDEETPGFNFLGFNIRQYPVGKYTTEKNPHGKPLGYKTYVMPSKEAIKAHYQRLASEIDKFKSCKSQVELIKRLNPIISGWSNYYSKVNSAEKFKELDHLLTLKLIAWAKSRHQHKSTKKAIRKYFCTKGKANWIFQTTENDKTIYLTYHGDFHIHNFVKVKGEVSPYNGNLTYWAPMEKVRNYQQELPNCLKSKMENAQNVVWISTDEEVMELGDIISCSRDEKDKYKNYQLLHRHCHDIKTKRDGTYDKSQIIEEPCDAKVSSTVLEPSYVGDSVA